MPNTLKLRDGYGKNSRGLDGTYRRMTVRELKQLSCGDHVPFLTINHDVRELKINGTPKTWITRPGHVKVLIKYGLYEYGYAEHYGGSESEETCTIPVLLVRIEE